MPVAALVLGILGLVVLSWLGPVIGFIVAGIVTASAGALVTWPLWLIGGVVGGLFPLSAVIVGLAGLKQEDSKGICVTGIVLGAVAALLGLGITAGVAALGHIGEEVVERVQDSALITDPSGNPAVNNDEVKAMLQQMNDPEFQKRLEQQLQAAGATGTASTQPAPAPSNLPAEAPTQPAPTAPPAQP